MNITVRFRVEDGVKAPVSDLMKKLAELDLDIIEIFNEADRTPAKPKPATRDAGDTAGSTAGFARGVVQNGN